MRFCGIRIAAETWEEARLLINLAAPTIFIQLGATIPPAVTASYIGRHLGAVYLDGFTLATLTANLLTLSLIQGFYSASDTLSPQAFGAGNYKEVGLVAIRAFVGSLLLMIVINAVLIPTTQQFLMFVREDEVTSLLAARWYRVYVLSLPFYALYCVLWKFLSAQEIMAPLVIVTVLTCAFVLPVALNTLVPWLGYIGSALALVVYQASQSILLVFYLVWKRPHHHATCPSLHLWREAFAWKPCKNFLRLATGGMMACSEWWYWEGLSLMVGSLGVLPLSVHAVPTQVLTVLLMIPWGVGTALSIRLGSTLPRNIKRAKQLAAGCAIMGTILFGIISILLYVLRRQIFHIFTTEQATLDGCESIWLNVSFYYFILGIYGINMGVAVGLGMQWTLGIVTFLFLWVFDLPAVWFFSIYKNGGLESAWSWVTPPYIFMNAALVVSFGMANWHEISAAIRIREGLALDCPSIEETPINHAPHYGSIKQEEDKSWTEEKKSECV